MKSKLHKFSDATITVNASMIVMAFRDLSAFDTARLTVKNLNGANAVTLRVTTSQSGIAPNSEVSGGAIAAPNEEGAIDLDCRLATFFQLECHTDGPGFPDAQIQYELVATWGSA